MDFFDTTQTRLALVAVAAALAVGAYAYVRWARRSPGRTIRVVGVGGAGTSALDAMRRAGLTGVETIAVNTDLRALNRSSAGTKIAIGRSTTRGLGTGGDVAAGEAAAREAAEAIGRALAGSDLVVIVAGLGGGTGSGAAPVIAEIARGEGALTVAVVTKPFAFEGFRKARVAQDAEAALVGLVDAVAAIPNDQVRSLTGSEVTVEEAFSRIDEILHRNVSEIVDLVALPGRINLDFADVRAVLGGGGAAAMGFGRAAGDNRAAAATQEAIDATLLGDRIRGAGSVLVNVGGSRKLRLAELDAVADTLTAATGHDTNLIFGVSLVPRLRDELQVTVIAPGGPGAMSQPARAAVASAPVSASAVLPAPVADATDPTAEPDPASDPAEWRPVWLRRSAPSSTPAPDSASSYRAEDTRTSRRARRRQAQADAERGTSAE